jgi:hypothetical protein
MRLDLSADPWGAAMLGTATFAALGLVVVLLALAMGTSKRGGAWILGLGCVAFLGTAMLGTVARVREADAAARRKPAAPAEPVKIIAPEVPPDVDEQPGGIDDDAGSGSGSADRSVTPTNVVGGTEGPPGAATGSSEGAAPEDALADEEGGDEGEPPGPAPPLAVGPAHDVVSAAPAPSAGVVTLDAAPDLPADPPALREAVIERLRAAKAVALDDAQCLDAKTLGQTWVGIAAIPREVLPDRVAVIVRRLDKCRRRIAGARAWMLRRERADARKAFAGTLRKRLASDHPGIWVATSGKDDVKLRVGAKSLAASAVESLLSAGLSAELEGLGFQSAFFSDGKNGKSLKLDAKSDADILDAELQPFGLQAQFPEP